MKHLLLTFFAVVLCYSLFFNERREKPIVDEINYIQNDLKISDYHLTVPDSMYYFSLYPISDAVNQPFIAVEMGN